MDTRKWLAGAGAAAWISLFLPGCGGGGGGGGGSSDAPAPYSLTPSTASASFVAGYPTDITLTARQTFTFTGVVYISVTADAAVIASPVNVATNSDGTFTITAHPLASLAAGHYTGNFTVNACTDTGCRSPLSGSPFKVPYDIQAISPDGGVTAYNVSALSALPGAPDWGTFQGNAAHTGFVPVTLDATAFNKRWKWDAPAYAGTQWTPSVLATGGGLFYVSSGARWIDGGGHEVFAYKESDGSKVWSHSFADLYYPSTNPPAFADGRLFIAAGSQQSTYMFAFDAATGTQDFKTQMASQWENYYAPTVLDGLVYTDAGEYGGLYAFDTTTGAEQFFAGEAQYDGWTPAVDATRVYAYAGGVLRINDSRSGTLVGSIVDPTFSWNGYTTAGAPVLGGTGIVYAGNLSSATSNSITSFDTVDMAVRWSILGAFAGNPAYVDGVLLAANNSPFELEAYKESDGTRAWAWTPPAADSKFVSDVLVTTNLVFVSTDQATYAIDRTTHQSVWSTAASGLLALSANGVLYIKGAHSITAINLR